jgi:hypothetical protein
VIAVRGDMRDPERILPGRILADAVLTELTDLAEPACVILSGVLRFADAGTARGVAAAFARAVVPGSYLIISCGSGNRSEGGELHLTPSTPPRGSTSTRWRRPWASSTASTWCPLAWSRCGAGTATARTWAWPRPPRPSPGGVARKPSRN